mgnify:CR=1 FL=1
MKKMLYLLLTMLLVLTVTACGGVGQETPQGDAVVKDGDVIGEDVVFTHDLFCSAGCHAGHFLVVVQQGISAFEFHIAGAAIGGADCLT